MHDHAHLRTPRRPTGPLRPRASVPAWLLAGHLRLQAWLEHILVRGRPEAASGPDQRKEPTSTRFHLPPNHPTLLAAASPSLKNFAPAPHCSHAQPHGGPHNTVQETNGVQKNHAGTTQTGNPSQYWAWVIGVTAHRPSTPDQLLRGRARTTGQEAATAEEET